MNEINVVNVGDGLPLYNVPNTPSFEQDQVRYTWSELGVPGAVVRSRGVPAEDTEQFTVGQVGTWWRRWGRW